MRSKFNKTQAPFGLVFGESTIASVIAESPTVGPKSISSFSDVETSNLIGKYLIFFQFFTDGQFYVLSTPIPKYIHGSKSGTLFEAGDSEKQIATVFVEGPDNGFASAVEIGQALKFAKGLAKLVGMFF